MYKLAFSAPITRKSNVNFIVIMTIFPFGTLILHLYLVKMENQTLIWG